MPEQQVAPPPDTFLQQILEKIRQAAGNQSGFAASAGVGRGGGGGGGSAVTQGPADATLVAKFIEATKQGKDAVDVFIARYGGQMDAATWEAIYAAVDSGLPSPDALTRTGGRPGGAPYAKVGIPDSEEVKAQLRRGGFLSGVYVTTGPTTWAQLTNQINGWLKSDEGMRALGDKASDISKLVEQKRAEIDKQIADARANGASASEIANLEAMKSPSAIMASRITALDPTDLLQYNPGLAGSTDIPAGTPIFLGPRTVELGQSETFADVAKRLNVPLDTLVAYQQREALLNGETFNPDKTYPGQQIYVPPAGFGEQTQSVSVPRPGVGEQTQPVTPPTSPQTSPSSSPVPTTGDPWLDMLYNSGGPQAEFASLIGPKKYSGPYGAYLSSLMPQAQQIMELQKLMNPTGDLRSAGVQLADLIAGLEAGKMPGDPQAILQAAFSNPRYRAEEAKMAAGGNLTAIGQLLGTLRGSGISGTAQSALYNNPDYIGQLLGQYAQLYPTGATNVPTFLEYLVKGGM